MLSKTNIKAQATIFIIIGIIVIALVIGYFVFRSSFNFGGIPANLQPVYTAITSCIEERTITGISILESQGGYIELPVFESGSAYMPFSSQLNFLGNPIPYWYYVSGNNIQKEQVPTQSKMEQELGRYVESRISNCDLSNYYAQGFEVFMGDSSVSTKISDSEVTFNIHMPLTITKGEETAEISSHTIKTKSKLGSLYKSAKEIYSYEQNSLFLENYGVDVLRLYAPVDGVELTCSPKTWNADEVFDRLGEAIEANTMALKTKDGDYTLVNKDNKYFVVDISTGNGVRFLNSRNWTKSYEVLPSEGSLLIAKPVGNQQGLGMLGFCYVPYHYVYNVKYPVLVQVSNANEIFQFPFAVVIQGNRPREPYESSAVSIESPELCKYMNNPISVNAYNSRLNPIEADISYECFGSSCYIGKTKITGPLQENFPQCANGFIIAKAEGYEDSKVVFSSINPGSIDVLLDNLYTKNVQLTLDGSNYNGEAIVSFVSETSSKSMVYPEQKTVELSEGQYEIQVYAYKNSTIRIDAMEKEQCVEVPKSGIIGIFGGTEKKCFDIDIPAQIISSAIAGGGKENYFILESELESQKIIKINMQSLPVPKSLEDLQKNYLLFDERGLDVSLV